VVSLNGDAVAGSFQYTPGSGALLGAGVQTLSVTFFPSDRSDISSVTQTTLIEIDKAPSIVSLAYTQTSTGLLVSASVVGMSHASNPTGVVTFSNSESILGTVAMMSDGTAQLILSSAPSGGTVTASYSGDSNYEPSSSAVNIGSAVPPSAPSFTLAVEPGTISVPRGSAETAKVVLTPVNGFAGNVSLSVNGCPDYCLATLSADSWISQGKPGTVVLSINTETKLATTTSKEHRSTSLASISIGSIATLALVAFRRRNMMSAIKYVSVIALICSAVTLSGCGTTPFAASPGTYQIVVTGKSVGNVAPTRSVTMTLTIQ
jgi:hypothetical protein